MVFYRSKFMHSHLLTVLLKNMLKISINNHNSILSILVPGESVFQIYLFIWGFTPFQHFTGHITMGSWKGRGNQYIQFVRFLYCKLPTNSKQLPAFPLETVTGIKLWPQRWEYLRFTTPPILSNHTV